MLELIIENLSIKVEKKIILKNINLHFKSGDVIAITGINGSGKSTLLKTIMGHFNSKITEGKIFFKNKLINRLKVDQRAKLGIFLSLQEPEEIDGLNNLDFLNAVGKTKKQNLNLIDFFQSLETNIKTLDLPKDTLRRNLNVNFSGGEKKKNEILQMLTINPKCILMDELDTGLDADTLSFLIKTINTWRNQNKIIIVVSHNQQFLQAIKPIHIYKISNETLC